MEFVDNARWGRYITPDCWLVFQFLLYVQLMKSLSTICVFVRMASTELMELVYGALLLIGLILHLEDVY